MSSLPSWIYCFLTYQAVSTLDQAIHDQLIYTRLMVHEALCHGGKGWLDYDRLFRQQVALNSTLAWNSLQPSLVASTILGQRSGTLCSVCQGVDHLPSLCAMTYLHQPALVDMAARWSWSGSSVYLSWNEGHCTYHHGPCFCQHVGASRGFRSCRSIGLTLLDWLGPECYCHHCG